MNTSTCRILLFTALCLFSIFAPVQAQTEVIVTKDIVYQTPQNATEAEKALCKLDVYAPKGAKNLPVLVWFHGGGLTGGDKAAKLTSALSRALASEGFVVASANHRLNPAVKYPIYIEDAAAAVAWMHKNSATYGGNSRQLYIGGHSAGGYLAALIGSDARYLKAHGIELKDIAGLIPISGQMTTHFTIRAERGLSETAILVDAAAPIHHASKDTPPVLLMHGENDMALRAEENLLFAAALKAVGNPRATVLQIAGRDHGGTISQMARGDDPVRGHIVAFIKAQTIK